MANLNISGGATGSIGPLAADTTFKVESGEVELSTDGGTTYVRRGQGDEVVHSSGLTITYRNVRPVPAILGHMAI